MCGEVCEGEKMKTFNEIMKIRDEPGQQAGGNKKKVPGKEDK